MTEIIGRRIDLSDGRFVFFAAKEDTYYVGFRNDAGHDTQLSLSREAKEALRDLLSNPVVGMPLAPFPDGEKSKLVWECVSIMPTT